MHEICLKLSETEVLGLELCVFRGTMAAKARGDHECEALYRELLANIKRQARGE